MANGHLNCPWSLEVFFLEMQHFIFEVCDWLNLVNKLCHWLKLAFRSSQTVYSLYFNNSLSWVKISLPLILFLCKRWWISGSWLAEWFLLLNFHWMIMTYHSWLFYFLCLIFTNKSWYIAPQSLQMFHSIDYPRP